MAEETRHAAWQENRFAVQLLAGGEQAQDLATGLPDYLGAVDFAVEWLDREDPAREQDVRVVIVETGERGSHEVWAYPPVEETTAGQELVELFGFNPAAWQPPAAARRYERDPRDQPDPQLRVHSHFTSPVAPLRVAPPPSRPAPAPAPAPATVVRQGSRFPELVARWDVLLAATRSAWGDLPSRCCLVIGGVTLWLALALAEPAFLVMLLAPASGLWLRRNHRTAPTTDPDDWF